MRYKDLTHGGKVFTKSNHIDFILKNLNLYWLIDSEIENASIEIQRGTIIWKSGDFYSGNWKYGIFKSGNFHGIWENGIFEGGNFKGIWKSGINELI